MQRLVMQKFREGSELPVYKIFVHQPQSNLESYHSPLWDFIDRESIELRPGQMIDVRLSLEKSVLKNTKSQSCLNPGETQFIPQLGEKKD
jgi:hypothetical protein